MQCLQEAFRACTPAQLLQSYPTIEGDMLREALFVEGPDAGRCRITRIMDTTNDKFGAQDISSTTCLEIFTDAGCDGAIGATQCATP